MDLILTHSNTDFDALASLLAAARLFPEAIPVLPQRMNRNLRDFLALYGNALPFVQEEDLPQEEEARRIILVDTQQIPALPCPTGPEEPLVEIWDHHPPIRDYEAEERYRYHGSDVGATVTLLLPRLIERGVSLSPVEMTLLLLGIYEDTGSLYYSGTTPDDLHCAAWLLEHGANMGLMRQFLNRPLNEQQLQIYQQLVDQTEVLEIGGWPVVVAWARVEEYVEEISTLAHRLADLYEPAALFLIAQLGGTVQIVARSNGEAVHVGDVMAHFGGGGRAEAAAAFLRGQKVEQVRAELLSLLEEMVVPMRTAADIMTTRLHTVRPETTLAQAADRMARYGHGALPVVDGEGRLAGLFTRRDLDRALHHGLESAPVSTYMWQGPVVVSPDTSVEKVRQTMLEHDVGRLLVVDEERRLLGIITRTDLLKLWPDLSGTGQRPAPNWAFRLEQALPDAVLNLLRRVGRVAEEKGYALYVVGGFVRDLFLGLPNLDLDLVVEGDAIALAQDLAGQWGGRARSHRHFGTAKWILEEARVEGEGLPRHLDFVTARTEFYKEPTALPTVEFSSLRHDLYRRDFTINTLAIGLSGAHYGRLFDFYGGLRDLERGLVRVLHNLSFIEDPTRILRAVRLEQRLGFSIEQRTLNLLRDALEQGLLERTTGERIRHELLLILEEEEPEHALARLDKLRILERLSPRLTWDDWLARRFPRVREMGAAGQVGNTTLPLLYLATLFYRLSSHEVEEAIARYHFRARSSRLLREMLQLRQEVVPPLCAPEPLPRSRIYRLLHPFSLRALRLLSLLEELPAVEGAVSLYLEELRTVRTILRGDDLRALGLTPGPLYRQILDALLAGRLDGQVRTRADEESLLERLLTVRELGRLVASDRSGGNDAGA